jgi:hypothetical protein
MKQYGHFKWLMGVLLIIAFIFNTSLINERQYRISRSMDNTIYQYNDSSGNAYFFYISPAGNCIMEYEPFSATRHTGEMEQADDIIVKAITMADYNYLVQLVKVYVSTATKETDGACGSIIITANKPKKYRVDCGSMSGKTVEALVKRYKNKYIITTGKAAQAEALSIKGAINQRLYESKKGVMTNIREYYFRPEESEISTHRLSKEYFIKLWEGKVGVGEIQKLVGKKLIIKAYFKRGLWDTNNEQHASRLGDYVAILEIQEQ